jgi:hypothetical protein
MPPRGLNPPGKFEIAGLTLAHDESNAFGLPFRPFEDFVGDHA